MLPPIDNILSVTDFTRRIKSLIEPAFTDVWIRGEISNLTRHSSGHLYFSLKDSGANLPIVCFKRSADAIAFPLKAGQQVICFGRISLYEPHGKYQLIATFITDDGSGRLQIAFEKLKQKLAAEGIFDKERKQAIPQLPQTVAIITSPTGAALHDFVSILRRRHWNGHLIVIPVHVQGKLAAPEIEEALQMVNEHRIADLIVLSRGGGSLEDLWPFNEEIVARAIASSQIPVVSAVGHEIDYTLSDFSADFRAETPSAAAELISSSFIRLRDQFEMAKADLEDALTRYLEVAKQKLSSAQLNLKLLSPQAKLANAQMRLKELNHLLRQSALDKIAGKQRNFVEAVHRFHKQDPKTELLFLNERLSQIKLRLNNNSHKATLRRGYAMLTETDSGNVLSSIPQINLDSTFRVILKDGEFTAKPENKIAHSINDNATDSTV